MFTELLIDCADIQNPTSASFDGLGDSISYKTDDTVTCRLRQLSAREMYLPQGALPTSTHRIYIADASLCGTLITNESRLVINGDIYQVNTTNHARSYSGHHMEIDATKQGGI